jgi:hypothetical protein
MEQILHVGLTPTFNPKFADTGSIADQTGNATPTFVRAVNAVCCRS